MDALFWKIWRFLEKHSCEMFVVTLILSFFVLYVPWCRRAWDIFFTRNEKVLDIYWQTLSFFLIVLIPILGQSFKKLEKDFAGIGAKIFFEQVVCVRRFWVLVPFSFLLFFAVLGKGPPSDLNQTVLTGIHYVLFVTWCFLFWRFFSLMKESIDILANRGEAIMKIFYDYLEGYQGDRKGQTKIGEDDSEEESWRKLWNIIDAQKEKWREKFLGLFWRRLEDLVATKKYASAKELLNDFVERYLELGKKRDQSEHIHWMNARKRWTWFYEKQGSDGKENPFAVVSYLLELHWQCWEVLVSWKKPGDGTTSDIETWGELYGLTHILSNTLENLFRDELDGTDDCYYSFFRCLRGFFDHVTKELSDVEKYGRYLRSVPIYHPVFEAASRSDLWNYEPKREASVFPNQWRVLLEYFEKKTLFTESEKSRGIQRRVWFKQFLEWSGSRIGHGKTEWDDTLDGALNMLFPEADASWMAWAVAYMSLSSGGSRIVSLCRWKPNFGKNPTSWFSIDGSKSKEEMLIQAETKRENEDRKRKDVAARMIGELRFFGNKEDDLSSLIGELENFKFDDELNEDNRQEICKMLRAVKESLAEQRGEGGEGGVGIAVHRDADDADGDLRAEFSDKQ